MPVSGIVLTCASKSADTVARQIADLTGVEVHGVLPDGRIVAVVESATVDGEVVLVSELHEIEVVVSVQVAYHNFEDLEAEQP